MLGALAALAGGPAFAQPAADIDAGHAPVAIQERAQERAQERVHASAEDRARERMERASRRDETVRALRAGRRHRSEELIVQFQPEATEADKARVLALVQGGRIERLHGRAERRDGKGDLERARTRRGRDLETAITTLESDPAVEFAEPDWIYETEANPSDPMVAQMWDLMGPSTSPSNPYGTGLLASWNSGARCSSNVAVGVVDEGVMIRHVDLAANVWRNTAETANGRDDDGNGYVDDVNGFDFAGSNASVYDGPGDDHGTHVAGTIAASTNNGVGVAGMCGSAKIVPAKFMSGGTGSTSAAIKAIKYLTTLRTSGKAHVVAINASWGGGGYSQSLYDAIKAAGNAGIVFAAAAGNSNTNIDATPSYPASYALPNVIAVAAIGSNGAKASFSSYGRTAVHIAAPGVSIRSTVPTSTGTSGYGSWSGTSMATPHVAGAAALYASLNPCATAAQIRDGILRNAIADPQLSTHVAGSRRLDVSRFRAELACPA